MVSIIAIRWISLKTILKLLFKSEIQLRTVCKHDDFVAFVNSIATATGGNGNSYSD